MCRGRRSCEVGQARPSSVQPAATIGVRHRAGEKELQSLLAAAGQTLQHRGLATDHGPTGIAAELVTALTHRHATIDLVIHDQHTTRRAVAIRYRHHALLCHHGFANPAATAIANDPSSTDLAHRTRRIITDAGGNPDDFDALDALLATPTGNGQIGATTTSSNGTNTRTGAELSWIDTPTGRVRITGTASDTTGWLSINPLHAAQFHAAVGDLAGALGGEPAQIPS